MVAFDQPGTTRDSIFIPFVHDDKHYTLIDTAGVRRRARVNEVIEKFSVIKTLQALEQANVALPGAGCSAGGGGAGCQSGRPYPGERSCPGAGDQTSGMVWIRGSATQVRERDRTASCRFSTSPPTTTSRRCTVQGSVISTGWWIGPTPMRPAIWPRPGADPVAGAAGAGASSRPLVRGRRIKLALCSPGGQESADHRDPRQSDRACPQHLQTLSGWALPAVPLKLSGHADPARISLRVTTPMRASATSSPHARSRSAND